MKKSSTILLFMVSCILLVEANKATEIDDEIVIMKNCRYEILRSACDTLTNTMTVMKVSSVQGCDSQTTTQPCPARKTKPRCKYHKASKADLVDCNPVTKSRPVMRELKKGSDVSCPQYYNGTNICCVYIKQKGECVNGKFNVSKIVDTDKSHPKCKNWFGRDKKCRIYCMYKRVRGECDAATEKMTITMVSNVTGCNDTSVIKACKVRKPRCRYLRDKTTDVNIIECDPVTRNKTVTRQLKKGGDVRCPQVQNTTEICCMFIKAKIDCINGKINITKFVDREKSHPDCKDWVGKERKCRIDCKYKRVKGECDAATEKMTITMVSNVTGCNDTTVIKACKVRKPRCRYLRDKTTDVNISECDPVTGNKTVTRQLKKGSDNRCPQVQNTTEICCIFTKAKKDCINGKMNVTKLVDREKSHPDCKDWVGKERKCRIDCEYKRVKGECNAATEKMTITMVSNVTGCNDTTVIKACKVRKPRCRYLRDKTTDVNISQCDSVTRNKPVTRQLKKGSDARCPQVQNTTEICCMFLKAKRDCINGKMNITKFVDREKSHTDCKDWVGKERNCKIKKPRCYYQNVKNDYQQDCDRSTKTRQIIKPLKKSSDKRCPQFQNATIKCCEYLKSEVKCVNGKRNITKLVDNEKSHPECKNWISKKESKCWEDCKYKVLRGECNAMTNQKMVIMISNVTGCEQKTTTRTCGKPKQ